MVRIEDFGRVKRQKGNVYFIEMKRKAVKKIMARLKERGVERITSITARDAGKTIEMNYNFLIGKRSVNLRMTIGRRKPWVETVIDIFPGAAVLEREVHDLFGVDFRGNPDLSPILLDRSSPKTPLIKRCNYGI